MRRWVVGFVCLAVFVGAWGLAACAGARIDRGARSAPVEASAPGWRRLPAAPIDGRDAHVAVWTGREMLVWGGVAFDAVPASDAASADGYSFDPERGTITWTRQRYFTDGAAYSPTDNSWRTLAPASAARPLVGPRAVWTGEEMLVFAVSDDGRTVALAYSSAHDAWRAVAPLPRDLAAPETAVWTGREMLVWSGGLQDDAATRRGAAYDPTSDRWRLLPDAPLCNRRFSSAVWTGAEMIVWGGSSNVGELDDGAAYNPATDTWRTLPVPPITARHWHEAIWTGNEMIVWGGQAVGAVNDGAAYRPADDTWRVLPASPLAGRHWHTWLWADGVALAWGGYNFYAGVAVYGDGARFDPATDRWELLPSSPLTDRCQQSSVWTGDQLILWGGTGHCGTYGPRDADGAALRLD
jgi:N-acetylneuraminic acid mutarotase